MRVINQTRHETHFVNESKSHLYERNQSIQPFSLLQNTEIGNMYENIIIFDFKKVLIPIFGITLGFFFSSRSQKNREVSLGTFYFLMK